MSYSETRDIVHVLIAFDCFDNQSSPHNWEPRGRKRDKFKIIKKKKEIIFLNIKKKHYNRKNINTKKYNNS